MKLRNRFVIPRVLLCSIAFALVAALANSQAMAQQSQMQPDAQEQQPAQPSQPATTAVMITGTIVKRGSNLVLRATSGTVYQLDAQEKAEPYMGKSVRITGRLEARTKLLHVQEIEVSNA
ncbi:MAG: DUF5818 domain-containing protein [Terracidiphilus sp.]|jgi:hypothetical protein